MPGEQWRDLEDGQARRFTSDVLPFDLLITKVFKNCSVFPKGPMFQGDGAVIDGYVVLAEKPLPDNEQNRPGAYLTVVEKAPEKVFGVTGHVLWLHCLSCSVTQIFLFGYSGFFVLA